MSGLLALWRQVPAIIRAPIIAFVVLEIGSTATVLPLIGNIKFHPEIPWAFPATLIVVAVFWWYTAGNGPPRATQNARLQAMRDTRITAVPWSAVLPAILLSVVAIACLRMALPSILPVGAPKVPFDLTRCPALTVAGLLLSIIVSAAVVEETAFRGYMQKTLEDAYGIFPAVIVTGVGFWFAHADKVSWSHLPFHLLASVLMGYVTYFTRSLWPAIVGHAAGDALLQPAYVYRTPDFVWRELTAHPVWEKAAPSIVDRTFAVWQAMSPSKLAAGDTFAIVTWLLIASLALSAYAIARLARQTRATA